MTKTNGWAWIHEAQRPIISARVIQRGKNKGKVEVKTSLQTKIINFEDIIKWPKGEDDCAREKSL